MAIEIPSEQVVRRQDKRQDKLKYTVLTGTMVFFTLLSVVGFFMVAQGLIFLGASQMVLCALAAFLAFLFKDRAHTEFDYCLADGYLLIAKVYNGKKRKEWLEIPLSAVEFVAPMADQRFAACREKARKKWNASLNAPEDCFFMYGKNEDVFFLLLWEPNEALLKLVKQELKMMGVRQQASYDIPR